MLVVIRHQIKILCLRKILQITQEIIRSSAGCIIIWKAVSRITVATIPGAVDGQGTGEESYLRTIGKRCFMETALGVCSTLSSSSISLFYAVSHSISQVFQRIPEAMPLL